MQYKVVAEFSNGRISEHIFTSLNEARLCALGIEAGSFATVTIFEGK